jgi:hypothetical protein
MTMGVRTILPVVVLVLGLLLMVAGIVTDKNGAAVVGLCSAAAACIRLIAMNTSTRKND